MQRENVNHDRRAINRFVKKMGLTRRKVRITCCIFLEGTLLILITYHLRNELKKQKMYKLIMRL